MRDAGSSGGGSAPWPPLFLALAGLALLLAWCNVYLAAPAGVPTATDFVAFRAAGGLALRGEPALAYRLDDFIAAQRAVAEGDSVFGWYYPPTAFLALWPLGLLPYLPAFVLWNLSAALVFALALRPWLHRPGAALLAFVLPAGAINLLIGQTGLFLAALLALGLARLTTAPRLAGFAFGLMAIKPHLGLLLPLALAAGGHWRAFRAATVTVAATAALSLLVFGVEPWASFLDHVGDALLGGFGAGRLPLAEMTGIYPTLRTLGAPGGLAVPLAALWLAIAASAVAVCWRLRSDAVAAAVLVAATLSATPYGSLYDMCLLTPVVLMVLSAPEPDGPGRFPRLVLVATALTPALALPLTFKLGVPIAGFALVALVLIGAVPSTRSFAAGWAATWRAQQRQRAARERSAIAAIEGCPTTGG